MIEKDKNEDFQPAFEEKLPDQFSVWELKMPEEKEPEPPPIDLQAEQEAQREQVLQQAREKGYEEGRKQAEIEAIPKMTELSEWLLLIQEPVRLLDKAINDEVIQTILWICEACIGVELSLHPEKLLAIVEQIKAELPSVQGARQLVMNPEDVEWLKANLDENKFSKLLTMLSSDKELVKGDFYLRGEHTELDGRLKSRLLNLFSNYFSTDEAIEDTDFYNNGAS
ncbi:FliH/SctL family protein [Legionella dresdenensis]|uniref:Flagellar assembly protein FliH n=2 Tax=Legionella dresdenensis TaxID=450200 RepID=A0ABV8CD66_9GAMM